MIYQLRRAGGLLFAGALLLAGCASTSANIAPTAPAVATIALAPTPAAPAGTKPASSEGAPSATAAPAAEAPQTAATEAPAAEEQQLATAAGEAILSLGVGSDGDQVGVLKEDSNITGPRSFRIGADGSIRLLDNANKRVLFFDQHGKLARALPLAEARDPWDFIVNNAGEVFVFDKGGSQVLRYGPKGGVTATIPLGQGVSASADGIMLSAAQDLMLVQNNQSFWVLLHQGAAVPPELQALTMRAGTVTPRSPTIFQTTVAESAQPFLHIVRLGGVGASDLVGEVDGREVQLPSDAQFFNVDRAMSLYFTRMAPEGDAVDVWRVNPDGTPAGGARIPTGGCGQSWRSLYVDQAGAAWSMCISEGGATVTRYQLLDPGGAPLPDAARDAADVAWKPGARLDAA